MRTIILTKGMPGSGKSTWAIDQIKKYPGKYKRFNKDWMREMLDESRFSTANEQFMIMGRNYMVERALFRGWDVIIDDTNFGDRYWLQMCAIAKRVGDVRVMEKYFNVSYKECLKRNPNRRKPVPEDIIETMYKKYVKNKVVPIRDEYFERTFPTFEKNPKKKDCIIVDVDGTVALPTDRNPYDNTRVSEDTPNQPIVNLVLKLAQDYEVIVVSGRDGSCFDATKEWLEVFCPFPNGFTMYTRKEGDKRKDTIVKQEIYYAHIRDKYNVIYVIDDRPVVCRMWRDLGLTVLQVNDKNF